MFKFFSFKKEKKEKITPSITEKLDQIIELLQQQQRDGGGEQIHIDHIHIEHLENIIFRLDNIEIDELSGKLIIGNNIRAAEDLANPFIQKIDKENAKKEAMCEDPLSKQNNVEKTQKGYRFRNDIEKNP